LKRANLARGVIHALLLVYAAILAYILSGLIFKFYIPADIFFDFSFVLLFFTLGQSFYELGIRKAMIFLITTSIVGFFAEVLGTSTGFPFGKYYYTDFLGPKIFGVPEVVPLVWFVIAYLTYSIARTTFRGGQLLRKDIVWLALFSAFGAVAWDFLVDPMFSSYGYWIWTGQFFPLPELNGIPLTNFAGWFVLVTLMLLIYLFLSKSKRNATHKMNVLDSRLAYFLLTVDGTVANWSLGNYTVIVFGAFAMLAFLAISYYGGKRQPRLANTAQVMK
jgi:uncharacterized membrane protein